MAVTVVGLTGGLASGKSTVERMLAEAGWGVCDAARAARAVVAPGSAGLAALVAAFGADILHPDGGLDRAKLREMLIQSPQVQAQVEAILHPLIFAFEEALIAAAAKANPDTLVVRSAPLMIEAGSHTRCHTLVVVDVDEERAVRRAVARGMDETQARGLLARQMGLAEKRLHADLVIDNRGGLEALRRQVEGLIARFAPD